jgi:hypothetical protein
MDPSYASQPVSRHELTPDLGQVNQPSRDVTLNLMHEKQIERTISALGKPIFDSLNQMSLAGGQNKLKFEGTEIKLRGLSEIGGETFTQEALERFCKEINEFVANESTALVDLELIEEAIPRAIKGLECLRDEVYGKQTFTKGTSTLSWLIPAGLLRESRETPINNTISQLEKALEGIKVAKESRAELRSVGMDELIKQNQLESKSFSEIQIDLKGWGVLDVEPVLDENLGAYSVLCRTLFGIDDKFISNEKKYDILTKCILLKNETASSEEPSIKDSSAAKSQPFESTIGELCERMKGVLVQKGKANATKSKEINSLLDSFVNRRFGDMMKEMGVEADLELDQGEWVEVTGESLEEGWEFENDAGAPSAYGNLVAGLRMVGDIGANLVSIGPGTYDTAINVAKAIKFIPIAGMLEIGAAAETVFGSGKLLTEAYHGFKKVEIPIAGYILMAKELARPNYQDALSRDIPEMTAENFAEVSKGLSDAEFSSFITFLQERNLIDRVDYSLLPEGRNVEFILAITTAPNRQTVDQILEKVVPQLGATEQKEGDGE